MNYQRKTLYKTVYLTNFLKSFKTTSTESYSSCWNCKKKHFKTFLVCGGCNYLQDPYESIYKLTYFQLFEM